MNKQIKVDLVFNANTQSAKAQIKSLQDTLNQAAYAGSSGQLGITPQIQKATQDALALKVALQNATNVNTGKLNLNKFQQQMKSSGMSAQSLAASLSQLGPQGAQAFNQLTRAIAISERKVFSLSGGLKSLAGTFFNTVRWSLASSAIQGVTSAISKTIDYAKELDTSLNNIRIVTGKGANEMARFAREANNMAKQLSTTTKAYTDASLIYFQQGLDKAAVKERTDTTIKLANVVGRSASEVSEWMTAIWNNFDDGSKHLEYYADVITKLGAATASSADEIAGGLEKFASIAETVGLSYEYAASALTTITAQTRQSEDVVGTALKTIFSRMENLSLGETLDDGTTLGKYSDALKTVGVNIKDANGNLKDMDIILQQTGERWATLDRASQVALAQSVAGIRQYAQFMSLMDNWDIMEKNVEMSKQSTGELEAQNAIYEQSAAAAKKRSQAAAEEIKASLFGGDDLKDFYDGITKITEFVGELIEAFGGLEGIINIVIAGLTKMYSSQIIGGLKNVGTSLQATFMPKTFAAKQDKTIQSFVDQNNLTFSPSTRAGKLQQSALESDQQYTKQMHDLESRLSIEEKQRLDFQKQLLDIHTQELIKQAEELDQSEKQKQKLTEELNLEERITEAVQKRDGVGKIKGPQMAQNTLQALNTAASTSAKFSVNSQGLEQLIKAQESDKNFSKSQYINNVSGYISNLGGTAEQQQQIQGYVNQYQTGEIDLSTLQQQLTSFTTDAGIQIETALKEAIIKAQQAINEGMPELLNQEQNRLKELEDELKYSGEKGRQNIEKDETRLQELELKRSQAQENNTKNNTKKRLLNSEEQDEYKQLKATEKLRKKISKDGSRDRAQINKDISVQKKKIQEVNNTIKKGNQDVQSQADSIKETVKKEEELNNGIKKNNKMQETLNKNMNTGFSVNFQGILTGLSSLSMGYTMATNAAQSLYKAIEEGDFSGVVASIMPLIMGYSQLKQGMDSLIDSFQTKKKVLQETGDQQNINKQQTELLTQAEQIQQTTEQTGIAIDDKATREHIQNNAEEMNSDAQAAATGIGKQIAQGPPGWITAALSLVPLLTIFGSFIGAAIPTGADQEQQRQERMDKNSEKISTFKESREAIKNVTDLTKSLKEMRAAGEDTKEAMEQLAESLPTVVDEFRKLEGQYGLDLNSNELNQAIKKYEETGLGLENIEQMMEEADSQIAEGIMTSAKSNVKDAEASFKYALYNDDGEWNGNSYYRNIGGFGNESKEAKILNTELKGLSTADNYNNVTVSFDINDGQNYLDYYEGLVKAKQRMDNELTDQERADSGIYEELVDEIEELSEAYTKLKEVYNEYFNSVQEEFSQGNNRKMSIDVYDKNGIDSLKEYEAERELLIQKIMAEYDELDRKQAEALLLQDEQFSKWEEAANLFKVGGNIDKQFSGNLEEAKDWYDKLPEELKTFTYYVNWETVSSEEDFKEQILKLQEESVIAQNKTKADQLGVDSATFDTYLEVLQDVNEALEGNALQASNVALANIQVNKGLEKLSDSFAEAASKITKASRGTYEYAEGIAALKKSMKDLFGVDVSTDYIEKYFNDIQKLAEDGNGEAFERLQKAAAEEYVKTLDIQREVVFDTNEEAVWQSAADIKNALSKTLSSLGDISVGESIELDPKYLDTLQKAVDSGQLSVDQLKQAFAAQGYDLDVDYKWIPGPSTRKTVKATTNNVTTETVYEENSEIQVPLLNGANVNGKQAQPMAVRTKDSSSIDTSEFQKNKQDKADNIKDLRNEVDRYQDLETAVSKVNRELDKMSEKAERAYGKDRLKELDQQIAKNEELLAVQKEYLEEIKKDIPEDKKAFESAFAKVGGGKIQYDEEGNILNKTEIENSVIDWFEKSGQTEDAEKLKEEFEKAFEQYNETIEAKINKGDEIEQLEFQIEDGRYEKIEAKLELHTELDEMELENIQKTIEYLGEDVFNRAEILAETSKQVDIYNDSHKDLQDTYKELEDAYGNQKISQADYIEGLKNIKDQTYENIDAIMELKAQMDTFYQDTLDAGQEEYDKYFEFMSQPADVLDHYSNILDIAGEEENYWKKGDILNGINNVRKNQLDTNVAYYEMLKEQTAAQMEDVAKAEQELEDAKAKGDKNAEKAAQDNLDREKAQYEAALAMQNEAEEAMLSSAEEYAQSLRDIYENEVAKARKELELAMTNGQGFDYINSNMERIRASTEEWYDDTNKIYETNKMIRNIQGEIDKTTNLAAKQKLKTFEEQTKQLQNQQKLSKTEMDIQQKRYDLLLAEIALEEAQNAKNQVRLQRDSEGNFGYVYTANQANVSAAQQKVDDAQNALYNTGLEGQKKYTELYHQTLQEYYDALGDLEDRRSTMTAEQYEKELNELNIFYNNMLTDYIYLGQVSFLAEDTRLSQEFKDGWEKTYDEIIGGAKGDLGSMSDAWLKFTEEAGEYKGKFNSQVVSEDKLFFGDLLKNFKAHQTDVAQPQATYQQGWVSVFTGIDSSAATLRTNLVGENGNGGYVNKMKTAYEGFGSRLEEVNESLGTSLIGGENVGLYGNAYKAGQGLDELYKKSDHLIDEEGGLKSLQQAIQDNKNESQYFLWKLTGKDGEKGLIDKLAEEYTKVDSLTDEFGDHWTALNTVVSEYGKWVTAIQGVITELGNLDGTEIEVDLKVGDDEDDNIDPTVIDGVGNGNNFNDDNKGDNDDGLYYSARFWDKAGNYVVLQNVDKETYDIYMSEYSRSNTGKLKLNNINPPKAISDESLADINITKYKIGDGSSYAKTNDKVVNTSVEEQNNIMEEAGTIPYDFSVGENWIQGKTVDDIKYIRSTSNMAEDGWVKESDVTKTRGQNDKKYTYQFAAGTQIYKFNEFDTGGYTGQWGPDGRWALLHQKEIVLNAQDTENFLAGINVLRDITKAIDLQAMSYNGLINNYLPYLQNTNTNTLQQDVTIHAEFPNATDHNEIQLALEGLVNSAAQRANRK